MKTQLPFVGVSVYFMPIPHCFDDCSFLVSFKIKCESSSFVLSFEDLFWYLRIPWYFMWILGWVFSFYKKKKSLGFFIGITLNRNLLCVEQHLNNLQSSNLYTWDMFHLFMLFKISFSTILSLHNSSPWFKAISKCFILFDAIVSGVVFVISFFRLLILHV